MGGGFISPKFSNLKDTQSKEFNLRNTTKKRLYPDGISIELRVNSVVIGLSRRNCVEIIPSEFYCRDKRTEENSDGLILTEALLLRVTASFFQKKNLTQDAGDMENWSPRGPKHT